MDLGPLVELAINNPEALAVLIAALWPHLRRRAPGRIEVLDSTNKTTDVVVKGPDGSERRTKLGWADLPPEWQGKPGSLWTLDYSRLLLDVRFDWSKGTMRIVLP